MTGLLAVQGYRHHRSQHQVADAVVRMRAADALEKVARVQPEWLQPFAERLLTDVAAISQPSVQWHLAQLLAEVPLDTGQRHRPSTC